MGMVSNRDKKSMEREPLPVIEKGVLGGGTLAKARRLVSGA